MGEEEQAGARFKALHADLLEKGRMTEAIDALKEFVRLNPLESGARATLAKAALESGDLDGAREFLDEDSAGDDPALLLSLAEIELRSGALDRARDVVRRLLAVDPTRQAVLADLGWSLVESSPEATFACVDTVVDSAIRRWSSSRRRRACRTSPRACRDRSRRSSSSSKSASTAASSSAMYDAQEQLTDAYLAASQAAEARVIAEDLVAREPWEPAHIDRFRKALVMLRVSDPDTLIAERLSGQAPFMAHDPFFDGPDPAPAAGRVPEAPPIDAEPAEAAAAAESGNPESLASDAAEDPALPRVARQMAPSGGDEIDLTGELGDLDDQAGDEPPWPRRPPGRARSGLARITYGRESNATSRRST